MHGLGSHGSSIHSPVVESKIVPGAHEILIFNVNVPTEPVKLSINKKYVLYQNYPNPFNHATTIKIKTLEPTLITLNIYDVTCKKVMTLADNLFLYGEKEIVWNTKNKSSGVYFYRLESAWSSETRKCLLIK